jgi:hypothetical protein
VSDRRFYLIVALLAFILARLNEGWLADVWAVAGALFVLAVLLADLTDLVRWMRKRLVQRRGEL